MKSSWEDSLSLLSSQRPTPKLTDDDFPEQRGFIEDTSPFSVVLCTRRAGKSYGSALRLLRAAYAHPGASCLYVALTRDSAKRILWKDVLKPINRTKQLGATFNETALSMTLPNGSAVYLLGADTDEEEKQKLLGQKYADVTIDEGASFAIDLHELVYGILKPAVADYRGSISLIGTPGNLKKGLFFELTQGQDPLNAGTFQAKDEKWGQRWSGHRWSAANNPHMARQWAEEIKELEAANPKVRETPLFQQHYLGRWVIDDSKLVYRYLSGRNDVDQLPPIAQGQWHYILGVDLGYEPDPSAFVVCAYHDHDRTLYVLETEAETQLDVTAVAERIKSIGRRYDLEKIIIDNANKQAVMEMQNRHGIALHPADKTGKVDFIELMNGDFISGYIKLLPGAKALKGEYAELIWHEKTDRREEHPGCSNHRTDGALYAWRYAFPYLAEAIKQKPPSPGTEEWRQRQAEQLLKQEEDMYEQALKETEDRKRERDEQEEMMGFM